MLSLIIGVCAGAAGAVGIATGISAALVGVMIAAALIRAAAAVGIGIVWASPAIAFGALVLLVVNAASIHVSGVCVFWYLGYRPEQWNPGTLSANLSVQRFGPSLVVAVVLLVLFATAGGVITTHIQFERATNIAVEDTLAQEQYTNVELMSVQAPFNAGPIASQPQEITVTVRIPSDGQFPALSGNIRSQITAETTREPVVLVEFVRSQRTPAGP